MITKDTFSLKGKKIIITGASSGIGRQCAVSCSQKGATIVLIGRDKVRLDETIDLLSESSGHISYTVDLLEYDQVGAILEDAVSKIGKVDGLINCAGISTTLPINATSNDKVEHFLRTNVIGPFNLTRQFVRSCNISESGGSIIFISSVMAVVGEKGKTLYSTTKGALISAARSMAVELASRKIRVNGISPGVVISPMSEEAIYSQNEDSLNKIKAMHPLGLGWPEDVANACVFLLSDAARWITGINLIVDGGYTAR
ncbi:MAG: SDR family oxidoreductase [Prolixibacteraceae bacterium]|jgi:NAD(P)-dependent dehydrogenase (short-subunit alcohol dehydrogenase family)|nr:SDR family oxidoreductase [Prolixibacteraceae bacterium]